MYFVVVESKKRDDGQKLGVDAICVCWPRARSPMAQRVSELGRSVPLNTAVLCWGLAQGLPHTQLLVGELVRGGGSFVGMAGSPSARSLGVDLNSALSRRPHFQTTRPIRKQAYPSTPFEVFCQLFFTTSLLLAHNEAPVWVSIDHECHQVPSVRGVEALPARWLTDMDASTVSTATSGTERTYLSPLSSPPRDKMPMETSASLPFSFFAGMPNPAAFFFVLLETGLKMMSCQSMRWEISL
jgi:hypothetical protein